MTVAQLDTRCWLLKEVPTTPAERAYPEPSLHFPTREEAEAAVGSHLQFYGVDTAITQWDQPCWIAKCGDCGEVLGDGGELDVAHYDCKSEAQRNAEYQDDHCAG